MPQYQHFYLGCVLSARHNNCVPLATIDYTLQFSESQDTVKWEVKREYQPPRYRLHEIDLIPAPSGAPLAVIAEQIRSRIFKITRANQDCTLVVDTAGEPAGELFHHMSQRSSLYPVLVIAGSGEAKAEGHVCIARASILSTLREMSGDIQASPTTRDLLNNLDNEPAVAVALALWQAKQFRPPQPSKNPEVQSGWGKVRLF